MKLRDTSHSDTLFKLSHELTLTITRYLKRCISLIVSYDFCLAIFILLLSLAKKYIPKCDPLLSYLLK